MDIDFSQYSDEELQQIISRGSELSKQQAAPKKQGGVGNFLKDFAPRTAGPILGSALAGSVFGPPGAIGGAILGTIGGNAVGAGLTGKPANEAITDTLVDTAFLGLPAAGRAVGAIAKYGKKALPLADDAKRILGNAKEFGISMLPTEVSTGLDDTFRPFTNKATQQAQDFFARRGQQFTDATKRVADQVGNAADDFLSPLQNNISKNLNQYQQNISNLYNAANKEFGDAAISGRDLYLKARRLGSNLKYGRNGLPLDPTAAQIVDDFSTGTLRTAINNTGNRLTGQNLDDINKLVNKELKNSFYNPTTNKLDPLYDDISNAFSKPIKSLETKLNPQAATLKQAARDAHGIKEGLLDKLGSKELTQAFNAGFRSPKQFNEMLKQNPDLLIDTFTKSKVPSQTLQQLEQLAGKDIRPYLQGKLAQRVMKNLDDVKGAIDNVTGDIADPRELTKNIDGLYDHLVSLGGENYANGILSQAKKLAELKYLGKGSPQMLAKRAARQTQGKAVTDNAGEAVKEAAINALPSIGSGALGAGVGSLIGGPAGGLVGFGASAALPSLTKIAVNSQKPNLFNYLPSVALQAANGGSKATASQIFSNNFRPTLGALIQGLGIGADYALTSQNQ